MTSFVYHDGKWTEGDPPLFTAMSHAVWLSSVVFDGARTFEGVTPDLDLHCARTINSCHAFGMDPTATKDEMIELAKEGIGKFESGAELYIRPTFWGQEGWIAPDPGSTQFAMLVYESPMPAPTGFSACLSSRRRPAPDQAMTDAKASCLYPNAGRALKEASARGYENAVILDPNGNIAEFATSNLFMVNDGVVHTPIPNGTFLNGITRQRVIQLLRDKNVGVIERAITPGELLEADEIFSTGNHAKVLPVSRYENYELQPGPIFSLARELYWEYAHRIPK